MKYGIIRIVIIIHGSRTVIDSFMAMKAVDVSRDFEVIVIITSAAVSNLRVLLIVNRFNVVL